MESFFSRYRNLIVLLAALLLQVIGLAVQVRKPAMATLAEDGPAHERRDGRGVLLIRLWAAGMVTPFERAIHGSGQGLYGLWTNYLDLRHTRDENRDLQKTIDRLRLEQASLIEDARQGHRLQELLKFQEKYIYQTTAAQVIGTSGSSQSRVVWLDKGSADGLAADMAVVTGDGIVGKVREVFKHTAQVLVINDQTSGAGVVLETTRIRGILRGNAAGQPQVMNVLADSRIQQGEHVLTAGGDQIFPRGLPVGVVDHVVRDPDRGAFIFVVVKPAADLQRLDEVLVITSLDPHLSAEQLADVKTSEELKGAEVAAEAQRKKAAAEMGERLPGLKDPPDPNAPNAPAAAPAVDPKTGLPVPVPAPATAKPIPALHSDRFSPGGSVEAPTDGNAAPASDAGQEKPAAQVVQPKAGGGGVKPTAPKPVAPKAGTPSKTKPAGGR